MPRLNLSRRQFLSGLAAAPLVAVSATSAYASLIAPYNYEVTETDVFIRGLPERFEGCPHNRAGSMRLAIDRPASWTKRRLESIQYSVISPPLIFLRTPAPRSNG